MVGAGAMGCLFGGLLQLKGYSVTLVDVAKQQIEAINRNGLSIETNAGKHLLKTTVKYAKEIKDKADLIIIFTKTYHTLSALESVVHLIGENTYILTVQNGLGNVEKANEYVQLTKIIVGTTNYPCDLLAPGRIRSIGNGKIKLMGADKGLNSMVTFICNAFNLSGLVCEISTDVFCDIWEKVAFNVALNSISGATCLTNGGISSVKEGIALAKQAAKEVIAVANAKGIDANIESVIKEIDFALDNHKQHTSSMLQDLLAKRVTEIDSLNGFVLKEANGLGIFVPATEILYKIIKILEQTYDIKVQKSAIN